jgi:hypothetical protein
LPVILEDVAKPSLAERLGLDEDAHPAQALVTRLEKREDLLGRRGDLDGVLDPLQRSGQASVSARRRISSAAARASS